MILRSDTLGLYIHWPFCQSKCPYCDFNSHVSNHIDQLEWQNAYIKEIESIRDLLGPRVIHSVFFGGGTPSLMDIGTVDAILNKVRACFNLANDCEITLEANPSSFEARKFQGFKNCGVNRVSIGVQSLNDGDLRILGRLHSAQEARQSVNNAMEIFSSVSIDLMYGRAFQSVEEWRKELTAALELGTPHMSLYQLTIEPNTRFGELYKKGKLKGLPNSDESEVFWNETLEICDSFGLGQYEISNFSMASHQSKHNKTYWKYREYIGIGPGAHGRLRIAGDAVATFQTSNPKEWLSTNIEDHVSRETLSIGDQATEKLLMNLRLNSGISRDEWDELLFCINEAELAHLISDKYIEISDKIMLTDRGRPLLNSILQRLID